MAGVEQRDKYRMRIYDVKQDWVKLERKRKVNNYVQKTTAIITREQALKIIEGDYSNFLREENRDINSIYFDFRRKYLRPVVLIDYIRDVFMLDYNDIRITFDKNLRANNQDLDMFGINVFGEPLQKSEVIIMEVKYNHCLPSWFQSFFKFESATASAISKYCQSRIRVNEYN